MRVWIPSSRFVFGCAALALAAAGVSASSREEAAQAPATAGSRFIVRAVSADGVPITDLKREEVSIRTDNQAREVRELELVRIGAGAPAPTATAPVPASTLPPAFATNAAPATAASGGREFLFIIDEDGIGPGREEPVRKTIAQMMAEGAPSDTFGVVSLRLVGGANIAPTTDRKVIADYMAKFTGGGSAVETPEDMTCRAKRALLGVTGALRGASAGRTLVIISPGVLATPAGITQIRRPNESQMNPTELCQIRSNDLEELGQAAAVSAANAYVFYYPEGLAATGNLSAGQQGLENVAGLLNASVLRMSGQNERATARILSETSVYYIATLNEGPAQVRRIDARSTRDGVRVSARPVASPGGAATTKVTSPRDMLVTQAAFRDVPLRAAAYVSRQGATDLKVVTLFEPADPSVKFKAASVGIVDAKGSQKQWNAQAADLARPLIAAAQPITPGKYRVRVAVIDTTGATGAVDFDLDAGFTAAPPLQIASMMLGVSEQAKGFIPKLQFTGSDGMAVGLVELYGVPKGATVTAQFQLAETETGPPLGDSPGQVGPGQGDDGRIAFGGFGIGTLAPGDYLMSAVISVDGKVVGKATRTLRKLK